MDSSLPPEISTAILESLPMGVVVLSGGKISWVNSWLTERLESEKEKLIGLENKANSETDLGALFGDDELLCITGSEGTQTWLQKSKVITENYEILFLSDFSSVVELVRTRDKLLSDVEALTTKDAVTGLMNRQAILQALELQVSRSRRYQNPLSLVELMLSLPDDQEFSDQNRKAVANLLKDQLRWADQVGHFNGNSFLLLLPETTLDDAHNLIDKLCSAEESPFADGKLIPNFIFEQWQVGDDPRKLLKRLEAKQTCVATS